MKEESHLVTLYAAGQKVGTLTNLEKLFPELDRRAAEPGHTIDEVRKMLGWA